MPLLSLRMFLRSRGILVAFCLWRAMAAFALEEPGEPDFVIQSWDRREGGPATVINTIDRAPNGYLWLATQKGLVRFDGEQFKLFDARANPELGTNWVRSVVAAPNGGLWVATATAFVYYPKGRPGAETPIVIGPPLAIKA